MSNSLSLIAVSCSFGLYSCASFAAALGSTAGATSTIRPSRGKASSWIEKPGPLLVRPGRADARPDRLVLVELHAVGNERGLFSLLLVLFPNTVHGTLLHQTAAIVRHASEAASTPLRIRFR